MTRCQTELQTKGEVTCVPANSSQASRAASAPGQSEPSDAVRGLTPSGSPILSRPGSPILSRVRLLAAAVIVFAVLAGIIIRSRSTEISNLKSQISNPPGQAESTDSTNPDRRATGWYGWSADAPPPAIAPFDAEQAKQHQAAWAKYLGVPVEYTNSLGMKFRLIPPGEFLMGLAHEDLALALSHVHPDDQ